MLRLFININDDLYLLNKILNYFKMHAEELMLRRDNFDKVPHIDTIINFIDFGLIGDDCDYDGEERRVLKL